MPLLCHIIYIIRYLKSIHLYIKYVYNYINVYKITYFYRKNLTRLKSVLLYIEVKMIKKGVKIEKKHRLKKNRISKF